MLFDVGLSDVCRVHPVGGRRVRPAGWMARIGWSGPARPAWLKAAAARFRCRPGRGHIVAAARLQLAYFCYFYVLFLFVLWGAPDHRLWGIIVNLDDEDDNDGDGCLNRNSLFAEMELREWVRVASSKIHFRTALLGTPSVPLLTRTRAWHRCAMDKRRMI